MWGMKTAEVSRAQEEILVYLALEGRVWETCKEVGKQTQTNTVNLGFGWPLNTSEVIHA